jgi:hypothetical protein
VRCEDAGTLSPIARNGALQNAKLPGENAGVNASKIGNMPNNKLTYIKIAG